MISTRKPGILKAQKPVLLFGDGIVDHLLAIPSIRALYEFFEG